MTPTVPLAFRVGITGTRTIPAADAERLRREANSILSLIEGLLGKAACENDPPAEKIQRGQMLLVSPLAEGSDRLVAEEALKLGYSLHVPLPFEQAEYEKDFPETVDKFRALLKGANILQFDGGRGPLENESYQEVGRFVIRNCDLLIAIWDGKSANGVGGTADIVRLAVDAGTPVWWIDSLGISPPRVIDHPAKLRTPDLAASDENAIESVRRLFERSTRPPFFDSPDRSGVFGFIAHHFCHIVGINESPLIDYLQEKPLKNRSIWQTYNGTIKILTRSRVQTLPIPLDQHDDAESDALQQWWHESHSRADKLSVAYGDRYRSSYVLIALFAFAALSLAAVGSALSKASERVAGILEGTFVAGIVLLVLANLIFRWHEKWITYRLLAELFRKQAILSVLGRSLPVQEVTEISFAPGEENVQASEGVKLPREAWIAWYFSAITRAAPLRTGKLTDLNVQALILAKSLAETQAFYHRKRLVINETASRFIGQFGEICFIMTAVVGGLKYLSVYGDHTTLIIWAAVAGACFSAASGAFVGVKAYSEFPLLVQQSTHMLRIFKQTSFNLETIDMGGPLASRAVGRALQKLAILMMDDVSGWMQVFRVKALEAG